MKQRSNFSARNKSTCSSANAKLLSNDEKAELFRSWMQPSVGAQRAALLEKQQSSALVPPPPEPYIFRFDFGQMRGLTLAEAREKKPWRQIFYLESDCTWFPLNPESRPHKCLKQPPTQMPKTTAHINAQNNRPHKCPKQKPT